jgi:hypothetical protein
MSPIETYLNDHLAGSTVAIELLEHLESSHDAEWAVFFRTLRADIESDRGKLETLMKEMDIDQSKLRKGMAWLGEKFTELKMRLDDPADGALRLFESLEALSLGIEGKRSLWLALAEAATDNPGLRMLDFPHLIARADEQCARVEKRRLEIAASALAHPKRQE